MSTRSYRLVVVVCALSWFLLGLHFPIVHQITRHGRVPEASVLVVVALIAVCAIAGLWVLLHAPRPERDR
jgi:uncharacterized membrane protein YuzA (DUF378 family)